MKQKILVSACLPGKVCRYNGAGKRDARVCALNERFELVPVCPEELGGLSTPRPCAERRDGRVVTVDGADVTAAFLRGAEEALCIAREQGIRLAVLKAKSPSCGSGKIYDGSFSGRLIPGDGVAAALFKEAGITVITEEELDRL